MGFRTPLPPALAACCAHLERGELDAAISALKTAPAELSGCAELLLLEAWVERRTRAPREGWLDSLLGAWHAAGAPIDFMFLRKRGTFEAMDESLATAAPGDADEALSSVMDWVTRESGGSPLMTLLALNRQPKQADVMARRALARLPSTQRLVDALWLCHFLSSRFVSPEVAAEAWPAHRRLRAELAARHPREFLLVADAVLDCDSPPDAPLAEHQVQALFEALPHDAGTLNLASLYRALVYARRAETSVEREACFADAVALLPDPLLQLHLRAPAALAQAMGPARDAVVRLMTDVGRAFAERGSLVERSVAMSLLKHGATAAGDSGALRDVEAQRAVLARVAADGHGLSLEWPVEGLRREAVDATAEDEWGLMLRTAFPPARLA